MRAASSRSCVASAVAWSSRRSSQGLMSLSKGSGRGIGPPTVVEPALSGCEGPVVGRVPMAASILCEVRLIGPTMSSGVRRSRRSTSIDFTALSCASSW